tara:strand:+ start:7309 stop:7431 length:123 start_codon:yes stop_codon:yes gene_type:complete
MSSIDSRHPTTPKSYHSTTPMISEKKALMLIHKEKNEHDE